MKDRAESLRKAAILIASLDRPTAELLLGQMSRAQTQALAQAVEALDEIDADEQQAVIDEFFRIGPFMSEAAEADELPSRASGASVDMPSASDHHLPVDTTDRLATARQPFSFLARANGATLAARLSSEHPQTIAVVVSHLEPSCGAEVLASLPSTLQAEVARRLVDLEETDAELLHEIERGLASWLNQQRHATERRTAGMAALRNILEAANPLAQEQLISNLALHDRPLAQQLAPRRGAGCQFPDLAELDDDSLSQVLSHADPEVLALAMSGAGKALVARACRVLGVARAARLRRALEHPGPMLVGEIHEAQRELAALASAMLERGELPRSVGRKLSIAI